jgi:hypothetical protein
MMGTFCASSIGFQDTRRSVAKLFETGHIYLKVFCAAVTPDPALG